MKIISSNQRALEVRFPSVWAQLQALQAGQYSKPHASIEKGKLSIAANGHAIHPYGKTKQSNVLERWLNTCTVKAETLYGITGFGDGSHIEALLQKSPLDSSLFVAEADLVAFYQVMCQKNCSALLNDPRLSLAIGPINQAFFTILEDVPFGDIKNALPLNYAPLYALNESYYDTFLIQLAQAVDVYARNYHSNIRGSGYHQEQIATNLPNLIDAADIGIAQGAFEGMPLVLVGAGPSLDESIDFIQSIKDKAIIVSVNSSYRKLINSGIKPHISMAADPRIFTFRGYENMDTDDVFLVCSYFVNPAVVEKFKGRIFTWAVNQSLVSTLRKRLGLEPPTPLAEMGTISSCVIDAARLWGCSKVILVGQDFAVTDTGQSHTEDSFYSDDDTNHYDLEECRIVEGNTLETVHTENRLFSYLKAFERLAEEFSGIEFSNTSRIGAKVSGIPYRDYEETLKWVGTEPIIDVRDKFRSLLSQNNDRHQRTAEDYLEAIAPSIRFAQKTFNLALEAALFQETLPEKFKNLNYANHSQVTQALNYGGLINKQLDRYPDDYQMLFDGECKRHMSDYMAAKKKIQEGLPHWQSIQSNREYFWAITESAEFFKAVLNTLEKGLKAQSKIAPEVCLT